MRLNGVCVALRNRVNPPSSTITFVRRRSPAWAPKAGPCRASDAGTQLSQNRSAADINRVISGLTIDGHEDAASAVRRARTA